MTNDKIIDMTTATITKTIKKVNNESKQYSIGFRRFHSLPARVVKNIQLHCLTNGENNTNSFQEKLNLMTENEFINWLKLA